MQNARDRLQYFYFSRSGFIPLFAFCFLRFGRGFAFFGKGFDLAEGGWRGVGNMMVREVVEKKGSGSFFSTLWGYGTGKGVDGMV